jgi:Putative addiction module component
MTDHARALTLPVDDRADVAAELLASLDEPAATDQAAVEAAWATEIEKRARRVMAGESAGEPWADVRARRPTVGRRMNRPSRTEAEASTELEEAAVWYSPERRRSSVFRVTSRTWTRRTQFGFSHSRTIAANRATGIPD